MNVYSRFWNWLQSHRTGQSPPVPFDHSAKLSLRKLEDRQVLSVSAVLAGLDVTFTGDDGGASADTIVFSIDNNGLLTHNLGGTNGFNSNIDLDNTVAGDQTLSVADIANLNIQLGADNDSVTFASDLNFASGNLLIEAESISTAGNSLTVNGLTTLDAGATNDINLDGANDFNTVQILSGHNVTLNDTSGLTFHGTSHVSGDLTVTALGAVTDDANSSLIVDGVANLTGTSIDLGNATNDHIEFGSLSFHSTGDVDIDADSSLTVSEASTSGNLTLVANDDVTVDATITTTGNISVTAGTTTGGIAVNAKLTSSGSILLDAADEIVISADIAPTTITLESDDDITIGAAITASDLISISAGQDGSGSVILLNTGALTADNVGNTADITIQSGATAGDVTLTGTMTADDTITVTTAEMINGAGLVTAQLIDLHAGTGIGNATAIQLAATTIKANSTTGNIDLRNTAPTALSSFDVTAGSGDVNLRSTTGIELQGSMTGNLTVTAVTGNLTDSDSLTITGTSSFTTSEDNADIDLGTLDATGAVTINTAGTSGNVSLINAKDLAIQGTVNGNLTATAATGNLTDSDALTVTGTSSFTTTQTDADIDLGTLASTGAVTLSTDGTSGNVNVVNATALALQGTVNGNLTAQATTGDLTDSSTLTVAGSSSFTTSEADADIDLGTLEATVAVTLNTAGTSGNATVINATALALQGTVNGNLTATATTGDLTDSDTLTISGASNFTTLENDADIVLDTLAATGPVTLSTVGTSGNATITNSTGLALQGTVNGDLSATTTAGDITDSAPLAVTGKSSFQSAGDIVLDEVTNDFSGAVAASGTNVTLTDANQILLAQITASSLRVNSGARITLGTGAGEDLNVTGAVTLNAASEGITEAAGSIISADQLELLGTGDFQLNEANTVSTLAANIDGPLSLVNAQSLTIGTVNTTSGIKTVNDDVKLDVTGDLTIGETGDLGVNDIILGTGNLTLAVTGGVSQTAGNTIAAQGLQVVGGSGAVNLDEANAVTSFAANRTGTISYRDIDSLTIGSVTDSSTGTSTSGITNDADVKITAGGDILIDQAINIAGQNLFLDSTGTITQTASGTITSSGLGIKASGGATLNQANDVDTLAVDAGGHFIFHDTDGLSIGSVTENASPSPTTLTGIVTSDDNASLSTASGDITLLQSINAGTGDVSVEATTGSIFDGNDGQTLITAKDLSLIAQTNIGDITDFAAGTGNAIEAALSGQLTKASVSDAGGEIFLNFQGDLKAAAGSVDVGGTNAASAILRATGGNVDVGTAAGVFSLSSGDNLGLEAVRVGANGGTLTLPDAGLNVGTGDLRLRGDFDVKDAAGRNLGPLVADDLSFTSGGNGGATTLNTSINTLTASVTGSGAALTVNEADGLTLTSVTTNDSNLTVNASQTAAGDITVLDVNIGTGRATLVTTANGGGQIIDGDSVDSSTTADITAGEIDLRAGTGIGNTNKLEVATSSFAATTASGDINVRDVSGDLTIAALAGGTSGVSITAGAAGDDIQVTTVGALTVDAVVSNAGTGDRSILLASDGSAAINDLTINANVSATGGNGSITLLAGDTVSFAGTSTTRASGTGTVQVRAGRAFNDGGAELAGSADGDITMNDGAVIQSDNGDITLSAPGNVQLSVVNANVSGTTGDLYITADADNSGSGEITEALTGEAPNLIGDVATLIAATGIGSAGGSADINTSIGTLVATNTTSGHINIRETDTLVIGGTGVQTQQGNGNISIDVDAGSLTVDSAVTANGSGTVTLNADTGAVGINASVASTTGNIAVTGDSVVQAATISTGGVGTAQVTADKGSITMQDGASATTDSGEISYSATGDVSLGLLQSNSGSLNVTADSDSSGAGAIIDNTNGEAANLVTTGTATLQAATGIGGTDDIDTTIGTLVATNTTSENISIQETDGLVIGGTGVRTQGGSGSIQIDVDAGNLTVNSVVTAQGDGDVTLNVDAGSADLSAAISSTTGNLTITADSVNQNAGGNLSTGTSGTIAVTADDGSITMADGTSATSQTGNITYSATGNVALGLLTATTGNIAVTAGAGPSVTGAITDNTAAESPNIVTTGTATLTAETGIGSGGGAAAIETEVAVLDVTNTTSGDIDITEADAVRIAQLSQSGGGNATVRTNNGTITVSNFNANPNAIVVNGGGALLLDANGATASVLIDDGIQAAGGNITIVADQSVIATSAPITSVSGNGNISIQAGNNIQILDPGNLNPVDVSVEGTGKVSLIATNKVVLGSQNPVVVPNATQHTVANDVLIQTGTGSITNVLPLGYDIQAPQTLASGKAVLSVTIGRPGETNLAVRVFWGDGTVETFTGLAAGTYSFEHIYLANPNTSDPAAPILVNAQVAHDPGVELRATNVNTSVRSIPNEGVMFPPAIPAQNINADLSAAVYDPGAPDYAALQPNVLSQPGNVDNPGNVVFQDTTLLATTIPLPGLGLAGAVFDTTPPVAYLTFPEASKVIDVQAQGVVQLAAGTQNQADIVRSDESILEERVVILEVLSPDGSILQRVVLPETTLDDMHDVIGKLPDGGYRFLLKEPGEDRLRLLLEFKVRQGKIADESDSSDRPPSAGQKKLLMPQDADPADASEETDPAAPNAPGDSIMQVSPRHGEFDSVGRIPADRSNNAVDAAEQTGHPSRTEWSSVAARLAWARAARHMDAQGVSDDSNHATATGAANASGDASTAAPGSSDHNTSDHAVTSLSVIAGIIGLHSVTSGSQESKQDTAMLSRAARLFRKIRKTLRGESASKPKLRDEAF